MPDHETAISHGRETQPSPDPAESAANHADPAAEPTPAGTSAEAEAAFAEPAPTSTPAETEAAFAEPAPASTSAAETEAATTKPAPASTKTEATAGPTPTDTSAVETEAATITKTKTATAEPAPASTSTAETEAATTEPTPTSTSTTKTRTAATEPTSTSAAETEPPTPADTATAKPSADSASPPFADPVSRLAAAVRIAVLGVAAIVQIGLCLAPLLRHHAAYHPAFAADLAFGAFAAVTATAAFWLLRRRPLPRTLAAAGTVVVLAASSAATAAVPADAFFREPHWSFGLVGWLLLLLLSDRPPLLVAALGVHAAVSVGQFLLAGTPARTELGEAAIVLFAVTAFQLAIGGLIRLLDQRTGEAAIAAAERERLETRAALAGQAGRDLRAGFAEQLGATLPLLAGLADGTLDPRGDAARTRCALAAAQLRRLFAENDDVPDPLVHEVTACLDVAERRGVAVTLAVSGDPVDVPPALRRDLTGPVLAALTTARTRARVSVLRTPDLVRVAVVADTTGDTPGFPGAADVVVTSHTQDGQTWMEARWLPA
ncbi:hypothetical protein OHS18_09495 [Amycolatopsis sp. NBC_00355]|uniref:hypothetical protein n=1 Tax=Amycolatopsis sp. NBC_00355 TaxID=2975957 RepID=UPI002E25A656